MIESHLKKLKKKVRKKFNLSKSDLSFRTSYDINSHRTMGRFTYINSIRTLHFNTKLIDFIGEKKYLSTVTHEFAHLVTHLIYPAASAHGREWKGIMYFLGEKNPTATTTEYSKAIKKAYADRFTKAKCKCQTHLISNHKAGRIRNGSKYICTICTKKIKLN